MPQPDQSARERYYTSSLDGAYTVVDCGRSIHMVIAECGTPGDARMIAEALNAVVSDERQQ